jgi:ubiquinone/menaquinone biosynthesis C-methylase UbiE
MNKASLPAFLRQNPFPHPLTLGFFYREKMRAIHLITPDEPLHDILEVGGGRSGLGAMLFPGATITNLDFDASYADAPCNHLENVTFVCADATNLPFENSSFDVVTMFDLLEHVPDDAKAVSEAKRVLRPGGFLLVSTPHISWKFPFHPALRRISPSEAELFAEWGHVRRGYSLKQLGELIGAHGLRRVRYATFINAATALCHDISFSRLPERARRGLCVLLFPLTWAGYVLHNPHRRGTETASCWQKSAGDAPA